MSMILSQAAQSEARTRVQEERAGAQLKVTAAHELTVSEALPLSHHVGATPEVAQNFFPAFRQVPYLLVCFRLRLAIPSLSNPYITSPSGHRLYLVPFIREQ